MKGCESKVIVLDTLLLTSGKSTVAYCTCYLGGFSLHKSQLYGVSCGKFSWFVSYTSMSLVMQIAQQNTQRVCVCTELAFTLWGFGVTLHHAILSPTPLWALSCTLSLSPYHLWSWQQKFIPELRSDRHDALHHSCFYESVYFISEMFLYTFALLWLAGGERKQFYWRQNSHLWKLIA